MKIAKGVIVPAVTPLNSDRTLDAAGVRRLMEHLVSGGVHGVFVLGTTGEGPSLSEKVRRDMIAESATALNGKIPLLAGISSTSFDESKTLAAFAARAGAAGVVAAPPCYFPPGEPEILRYYEKLAGAVELPLYVYNMPSMTKIDLKPEIISRLVALPNVAGIKDSSGSMVNLHQTLQLIRTLPEERTVLVGPEELLAETVLFGGDGGVPGGGNVHPRLFVAAYEAARRGDLAEVRKLQDQIYTFRQIYTFGHYNSGGIKGLKCALKLLGICGDTPSEPAESFAAPERAKVSDLLHRIGLL